ncbi:ThiF family adenylyltransferase [Jeotgalibacillus sp. JSM ZJ347]|uniref:HesA/MoeB/ThiF family protein n=1 Tax=Jeotgalibacillus sp. JSM ZJ347 TaxID=3342117 RepID=UPI0035A885A9
MANQMLWYEEMPEIFNRERKIMREKGFTLKIINKTVEFSGRSKILPEYPLRVIYPEGFPSFPPTVISDVGDELLLVKHQRKLSKVLCCFGFSSERWRANLTAREVIHEAEDLIANYSPQTFEPEYAVQDDVPEPIINEYDYSRGGLLIPLPFGDLKVSEIPNKSKGYMRVDPQSKRGILKSIISEECQFDLHSGYEKWFGKSPLNKVEIFRVDTPPPLRSDDVQKWLADQKIRVQKKNNNQFIFFVFEDEWGTSGNKRLAWIGLKITQEKFEWIQCYLVSTDDSEIRTPTGKFLSDKKVTVIGVGSLGSLVATTLAQEGIKNFSLIDYDEYEPSNAIRHQVKQSYFGTFKVIGVKHRIQDLSPTTKVIPIIGVIGGRNHIEVQHQIQESLISSDIIIDTTGEHSVTHYLNRFCVKNKQPLIIGSVTNGAWSAEVINYIPGSSGCWGCWHHSHGHHTPPGAPLNGKQFAPGCDQPTFIGGVSSVNIASGLIAQRTIDTLLNKNIDEKHYIIWSEKDHEGNRSYSVNHFENPRLDSCGICNDN